MHPVQTSLIVEEAAVTDFRIKAVSTARSQSVDELAVEFLEALPLLETGQQPYSHDKVAQPAVAIDQAGMRTARLIQHCRRHE